jgi:ABC-type uncharacterized transport system auxiliary subunit
MYFAINLPGCSALFQQAAPDKSLFAVEPGDPLAPAERPATAASTQPVIQIRPVQISTPYDGTAFVYKTAASQFEFDYYNNFITAPSGLITSSLAQWFGKTGTFSLVETNSTVPPDLMLECNIGKLLIDFTNPAHPHATITAHFLLYRGQSMENRVISDTYGEADIPLASNTPAGYVAAWGQALRQLFQQEQKVIRGLLASGAFELNDRKYNN